LRDFAEEQAMGYTSGAAMEDRGLRDIERWRDKIEVRLDNRQVFFLFFGSALVACMLFVLGVIVGKRLESRGRAVSPEIEDPLALLDKVATSPRPAPSGVTFPQALFGTVGKAAAADKHGKKETLPLHAGSNDHATAVKPLALAEPVALPPEGSSERASADRAVAAEGKSLPVARPENRDEPTAGKTSEPKPTPAQVSLGTAKETKPVAIPTIAAGADSKSKGRFTLQLSSFQDKTEAEAFAKKFDGERPYLVVSEIPGKGTWYRVRVGDYPSAKDAAAAKQSFEKKHSVIAYVAQK
jgi:cell division septation protein DedD